MAIHKKMKGSSRGHFLRQSATSRFLSCSPRLSVASKGDCFYWGKCYGPMERKLYERRSRQGGVTGVDLLRQGRIRIWDGEENGKKAVCPPLPRLLRMHTCRFSICRFHQSRLLLLLLCLPLSRKYHISSLNEMLSLQSFLPV